MKQGQTSRWTTGALTHVACVTLGSLASRRLTWPAGCSASLAAKGRASYKMFTLLDLFVRVILAQGPC